MNSYKGILKAVKFFLIENNTYFSEVKIHKIMFDNIKIS